MTIQLERGATGIPLLPENPRRFGPQSRFLVLRMVAILAVVQVVGLVLVVAGGDRATAAGLSMVVPGGGLLFVGSPEGFALTIAAMFVAVVVWWGISAHFAIPLVWSLSVVASAWLGDGGGLFTADGTFWRWSIGLAYLLALAVVGSIVGWSERKFRRKRSTIPMLNEYLDTAELPKVEKPIVEPDEYDAIALAWAYDLALQPIDDFLGFDWGEQFHGPTCVRYQIDMLGWALAGYAANHVPNAPQPIERAMRNLIEKLTDLRVWRYWRTMNLIGNFDANPDPIVRDNIMLSAWTLNLINIYKAATGSTYFDEPGSLTFVWSDGRTFPYDHHSLAKAVRDNYQKSRFGFFPCEPGWAFTACNTIGAEGLFGYDVLNGTNYWSTTSEGWRRAALEEYVQPDGMFPHIKSTKVGLSFDTGEVDGGEYAATGTNSFVDIAPDLAARSGALNLRGADEKMADLEAALVDGELAMELPLGSERNMPIETAVPAWTRMIGGARALGRFELAAAAKDAMWRQCGTGEVWPNRPLQAGVQTIGTNLFVAWGTPIGTAALNQRGYVAPVGPLLGEVPWPDVLVTKARSDDDRSLDLALRPNRVPRVEALTLTFSKLEPGSSYEFNGVALVADQDGRSDVTIDLEGPLVARLEPVDPQ